MLQCPRRAEDTDMAAHQRAGRLQVKSCPLLVYLLQGRSTVSSHIWLLLIIKHTATLLFLGLPKCWSHVKIYFRKFMYLMHWVYRKSVIYCLICVYIHKSIFTVARFLLYESSYIYF